MEFEKKYSEIEGFLLTAFLFISIFIVILFVYALINCDFLALLSGWIFCLVNAIIFKIDEKLELIIKEMLVGEEK